MTRISEIFSRDKWSQKTRSFKADTDGSMIIFGLFIFIMMLWSTGMAIDFMRHEQQRVRLQGAMDRAVLAAASRTQRSSPRDVIQSYIDTTKFLRGVRVNITAPETVGNGGEVGRTVRVEAMTPVNMMFLNMLGIDQIPAIVTAGASTNARRREVSIVLDVSGSMGWRLTGGVATDGRDIKIGEMKFATKELVKDLLADGRDTLTSINIIPYTGYVNVGKDIAAEMNIKEDAQPFSHCIVFDEDDFRTTELSLTKSYDVHQDRDTIVNGGRLRSDVTGDLWSNAGNGFKAQLNECPIEENAVLAHQNDFDILSEYIDNLRPIRFTSTHLGAAWGAKMLDPTFRPAMKTLREKGEIPAIFSDRPVSYETGDLDKVLIIMTDGENTKPRKLKDQYYSDLSHQHHFSRFGLNDHARRYCGTSDACVNYATNIFQDERDASDTPGRTEQRWENDQDLTRICTAAKVDNNVSIWTIAFELSGDRVENLLRGCATGDGENAQFEKATGQELTGVFKKIAATITKLRLTE